MLHFMSGFRRNDKKRGNLTFYGTIIFGNTVGEINYGKDNCRKKSEIKMISGRIHFLGKSVDFHNLRLPDFLMVLIQDAGLISYLDLREMLC